MSQNQNVSPMIRALQQAHDIHESYSHLRQKPLYSTIDLKGYADPSGFVSRQKISFFQAKQNTPGQGFPLNTTLHPGLTNFSGSPSTMPNDETYISKALGVQFLLRPNAQTPRHALQHLTAGTTSLDYRRGDSTAHGIGPLELWPAGRYGLSDRSIAVLGAAPAGGAVSVFSTPQNGDSGMRVFEDGSEIVFLPGSSIEVNLHIHEGFYLTDDGLPATNPNDVRSCLVRLLLDGFSLSRVAA